MNIISLPIDGAKIIETDWRKDPRGGFARLFCENELASVLEGRKIKQINQSKTASVGAVRGMHFQYAPDAEMKFVRCLKGQVFDVFVDLRQNSKTYLKWHGEILSAENARMLVIPEGCAHGFQVMEANSELLYLHTAVYAPANEAGILFNDPKIGIKWPLDFTDISDRDRQHNIIDQDFAGFER